jgi:hypothetical protein
MNRFQRAIAAIDAANAADPNTIEVEGKPRPKELAHAEMVSGWIERLVVEPDEALLLAARAHHLRRWMVPRAQFPAGLAGYHRWRRELQRRHAEETGRILAEAGYDRDAIERVAAIIQKRDLGRDPQVQALEDALCLVFMQTQLAEFAAAHSADKVAHVVGSTVRKMSPAGREAAAGLELAAPLRRVLLEAIRSAGSPSTR